LSTQNFFAENKFSGRHSSSTHNFQSLLIRPTSVTSLLRTCFFTTAARMGCLRQAHRLSTTFFSPSSRGTIIPAFVNSNLFVEESSGVVSSAVLLLPASPHHAAAAASAAAAKSTATTMTTTERNPIDTLMVAANVVSSWCGSQ
jgi:hypothetical protein